MSVITSLTRMWLTRSVRPFIFKNEYDQVLPYSECENLGLYVHIPFCRSICSFCPYCKTLYSQQLCSRYVDSLLREIRMVGGQHDGKKTVTSLYFGGGTPALASDRFREIIDTIREHFTVTRGIGAELHPDDVNPRVLQTLKDAGVTKISIGVQSFREKYQSLLGRKKIDTRAIREALASVPFETVSMDFIFALPGQTFDDLRSDIDEAFSLGANHVAVYPFIDFSFTDSRLVPMPKNEKRRLLDEVVRYCSDKGYTRGSIWTFSKGPEAEYSSMTRENYIGFGCSAVSLFREQFKINTFDVRSYCERIDAGKLATSLTIRFSQRQRMVYWLFWTAYGMRVKAADFERFFGVPLKRMYGLELWTAQRLGWITERNGEYELTPKGAFYYHYYENYYTLAYIDRMWGVMRKQPFPERLEL